MVFGDSDVREVVILAGGLGTRLKEETQTKPKPMVNVGDNPILVEIISHYVSYGCNKVIICGGYKIDFIREYFLKSEETIRSSIKGDVHFFLVVVNNVEVSIKLINTGLNTPTGGRLKLIANELASDNFYCTYGDGLGNVNLNDLQKVHFKNQDIATITAVQPPSRFGVLELNENGKVLQFHEKPKNTWVNGGFFLFSKEIFKFLTELSVLEVDAFPIIAKQLKLSAYKHSGFWYPMDTLRDYEFLNELAKEGEPPWR